MPGAVQDVITHANFCEDRLRGFGVARGRILALWLASSPLKHSHYRRASVWLLGEKLTDFNNFGVRYPDEISHHKKL